MLTIAVLWDKPNFPPYYIYIIFVLYQRGEATCSEARENVARNPGFVAGNGIDVIVAGEKSKETSTSTVISTRFAVRTFNDGYAVAIGDENSL